MLYPTKIARTPAKIASSLGVGRFRLTGLFLVVASLTFLGVAISINISSAKSEEERIIASTTEQSVKDAKVIAGVITGLLEGTGNSSLILPSSATGNSSSVDIGEFLSDSNIVRLSLYRPTGSFIWSSTFERADIDVHQTPIFQNSARGTITSGLIRGFMVSPPGEQPYSADVVETFIPLIDAVNGVPVSVLGVTRDVTYELTERIGQTRAATFRSTMTSLSIGFVVLLAAVLLADIHLRKQRVKAIEHERKLASTKLDLVNRELEQTNEERTKFLSTVSHELKTPLTSMMAFTDMLVKHQEGARKDKNLKHLGIIKKSGKNLQTLINDLLDFSRLESGGTNNQREEFEMDEVVAEVESSMSPLLGAKQQTFVFRGDFGGERVRLDRRRIGQVVMNLVSNASKYSPAGTTITFEGSIRDSTLHLAVIDEGIGISSEDQERLFTKFFRAENKATRSEEGTGLGLSITKGIVESHGGTISVESQTGKGTKFSVTIPTGMPAGSNIVEFSRTPPPQIQVSSESEIATIQSESSDEYQPPLSA
ncbi:MAG: HAMP domain-containing histidine kinase [Chloroflexi bacterium]|nr:HAMP domain-containing histidine kinase [Chloroflexota bacterium]